MKKNILSTLAASALTILSLTFVSCQEPIFEAIREDVAPEEATVSGNISSITRYTVGDEEYLVLSADGGIRYKQKDKNSHGEWNSYSTPFSLHHYDFDTSSHSGEQLLTVLADSTTLYLISVSYGHTSIEGTSYPDSIHLWAKNITANGKKWSSDGEWTSISTKVNDINLFPISYNSTTEVYSTKFRVFQTNAPQKAHRAAFIRSYDSENSAYKYFKLNGTDTPLEITLDSASIIDPEPSSDSKYVPAALSAVYFNGEIKFFTSPCAATNETYTDDATYYYYTDGDEDLYYSDGSTSAKALATGDVISALATCKDSILIGHGKTSTGALGGISRVLLTDGLPANKRASFETNAQFQITTAYQVLALVNATPEKNEIDSSLYASITFSGAAYNFDNVGLWSYYPDRGNWNRE